MSDFVDDYGESAPFSEYYPDYQKMGYRQLRTYFTWRARLRRGEVTEAPVAYAFVYIYELLNNIGVETPAEGFDVLLDFWLRFRKYGLALERYVPRWLKEYYIYYGVPGAFQSLAGERGIAEYYPEAFAYGSDERTFAAYADISSYDIRKSRFYGAETAGLARDCFLFVLDRFRGLCADKSACFEDAVFYPCSGKRVWKPFGDALFYHAPDRPDRKIVITKRETYAYRRNHWVRRSAILSDSGRRLVGYIMKAMESELRRAVRFKYSIKARTWSYDLMELEKLGIDVGETVKSATAEFYAEATRTRVSVDAQALGRIRREAADTRDKLLVPEDETPTAPDSAAQPDGVSVHASAPEPAQDDGDPWGRFLKALTRTERGALDAALQSRDIDAFADADGVMPEVLADGINQKAADIVGDVILEYDGAAAAVYEDYRKVLESICL
jgi:hypothetical protein